MDTEKINHALKKIGFSPNEIKVYLTLNKYGSTKAGVIAKYTHLDRSSVYNAIKLLQEKGMLSYVLIGQVKYFQPVGPKRLLEYVREQETDLEEIVPELHRQHKAVKAEGQVRLFKGIKGIKAVFLDMIRTGKDNFAFGSEGQLSERMPEFAYKFDLLKKEKKIHTKLLIKKGRMEIDSKTSEYRYMTNVADSSAVTNIYGDKVAIIIWTDEPEAVVIENAEAAKGYKSYFDLMWKNSKPIKK